MDLSIDNIIQKMRWIPPGQFMIGASRIEKGAGCDDDELPQHQVSISKGFWLFDTAVTQALWKVVMKNNPSEFKGDGLCVENVSWDDCQKFIDAINKKIPDLRLSLPTEAQWEYACRAGTTTAFSLGDEINPEQVNYDGNYPYKGKVKGKYRGKTVGVKVLSNNLWGLYQMHGNVLEWCLDGGREYSSQSMTDPLGPTDPEALRVLRGGSWVNVARDCRSAIRFAVRPGSANDDFGFRCAPVQNQPGQVAQPAYSGVLSQAEREGRGNKRGEAVQLSSQTSGIILNGGLSQAQLLSIRSDKNRILLEKNTLPTWASAMGRDAYGLWAEFSLEGEKGEVVQRMRWIPPGQFLMGSPEDEYERSDDEGPQHFVTLSKGYWLFDTAVTQELWEVFMGNNPSRFKGAQLPVETVSWEDCQEFITMINEVVEGLNLSLPTEAQWEYACRAGTHTAFNLGEDINPTQVNYNGNYPYQGKEKGEYRRETIEVKELLNNPWGLYQMHGNVWEWCMDGIRDYSSQNVTDPLGPSEPEAHRVLRGGSWFSYARFCRSATRDAVHPDFRSDHIGFRCALVQD